MIFFLFLQVLVLQAFAGRPLITDDADVIGKHQGQLETWVFGDRKSLQHWFVPTVGIGDVVEVSASGVQGATSMNLRRDYSVSGPILQTKINLRKTELGFLPGLAFAAGAVPPIGFGVFSSPTWEYFFYLAGTSYPLGNDLLLVHVNLGRQTRKQFANTPAALLWGTAVELRITPHTYAFIEAANGEVYALTPGVVSQVGLRHEFRPGVQIDGTLGNGLSGEPVQPLWGSLGIKVVTDLLI